MLPFLFLPFIANEETQTKNEIITKQRRTLVVITLNHDTHDSSLPLGDLLSNISSNLGLVPMILERITMAAVNHESRRNALLLQGSFGLGNASSVVVGPPSAASQDNKAVLVSSGADNGNDTGLGDGQEVVRMPDGANGVNGNAQRAVGAVLESHGEAQAAGQLAMKLALGGSGANSTNREQVGQELGGDGIQHLTGNGHALGGQVDEELAGQAQALVDLEAAVDVGVVDEALPANSGAGLLKVRAHDDEELILVLFASLQQEVAVGEGGFGVVDGAGADDDEQTFSLVRVVYHGGDFIS